MPRLLADPHDDSDLDLSQPPPVAHQPTAKRNADSPPVRRFRVIAAFMAVAFLQGLSFATFALVPELSLLLLPTLTLDLEGWTLNCNNFAQMVFIPLAIFLLRNRKAPPGGGLAPSGLRITGVIAVCMQFTQSMLWYVAVLLPPESPLVNVLLILGSCAAGVCTGCVQGACSRLSAVWFPPDERGSATGSVYASLFLGQACATAASLFFCSELDIKSFLLVQLIASVLLFALVLAWFPDRPASPPLSRPGSTFSSMRGSRPSSMRGSRPGSTLVSPLVSPRVSRPGSGTGEQLLSDLQHADMIADACEDAAAGGERLSDRTMQVCGRSFVHPGRSAFLILLAVSWSTGGYQAYQQVLPLAFADEGSAALQPCNETISTRLQHRNGDLFALASAVTYALGGPVAGILADKYFVRRLKRLMLISFLALGLNFGFIIWTMPPPPFMKSDTGGAQFGPGGKWLSLFAVSTSGLFAGMTAVPALELLAEAQTLSEGASANLVMFGIQIFAILMTYLANVLSTPGLGVLMCAFAFCCLAVCLFVKEVYARLNGMETAASLLDHSVLSAPDEAMSISEGGSLKESANESSGLPSGVLPVPPLLPPHDASDGDPNGETAG